ncbi:hypothetical protein F4Y93_06065 [Candidatus Poribacteria bacterium]|nr:hypothetical protein [Candidatus Poribacteria bacterium]
MKTLFTLILITTLLLTVSGCLPNDALEGDHEAGFFSGIWHGWLCWLSFILGIFTDIRIYAAQNTGWWYDCGWMLGAGLLTSKLGVGLHFSRRGVEIEVKDEKH